MNFWSLFENLCKLLLFKKKQTLIERVNIENNQNSLEIRTSNSDEIHPKIDSFRKTLEHSPENSKSYLFVDNKHVPINSKEESKLQKDTTYSKMSIFDFFKSILLRPFEFLISLYRYYIKGMVKEVQDDLKFTAEQEIVARESMRIVSQIARHSKMNFKNSNQFHKLMKLRGNSNDLKIRTKRCRTPEEYFEGHKLITKLFMNYLMNGSVYRREMLEIFTGIMEIMEDKVMLCYLRALRINISKLLACKGSWGELEDLIVLGYKAKEVESVKTTKIEDKKIEVEAFNEKSGRFEPAIKKNQLTSTTTAIPGTSEPVSSQEASELDRSRIEQGDINTLANVIHLHNEKTSKISSSTPNDSSSTTNEISLDSNLTLLTSGIVDINKSSSEALKKESDNFSHFNLIINKLKHKLAIPIQGFTYYEKYGSISFILELIYPMLKDKESLVYKKLFSNKGRSGSKMIGHALNSYKLYMNEVKKIIQKYDNLRDLYPFKTLDVLTNEGTAPKIEISDYTRNFKQNDSSMNRTAIHLTKTIDFVKLMFFFKLYIYISAYQNLDLFENKKRTIRYLSGFLECNENTFDDKNFTIKYEGRDNSLKKGNVLRRIYNVPNHEFIFKIISKNMGIKFKVIDTRMVRKDEVGKVNDEFIVGKINSEEYIYIKGESNLENKISIIEF